MKITAIKSLVCNARMRNWVFVKVETDQPGLVGWGEATLEWHTRSVVGAVEDLATLLMGEDPRRIEHLWQMMFRQHFWHSSGIVRATAMSGIDIALWDIAGKDLGRTVPPPVGWPRARLRAPLLPLGRRTHGGLLRDPGGQCGPVRRPSARGGGQRIFSVQVDGGASDRRPGGNEARVGRRAGRRAHARRRRRWHRHHGRLPCSPLAAHGHALRQGPRTLSIVFSRGAVLAGGIPSARSYQCLGIHADCDRREIDQPHPVQGFVRGTRLQRSYRRISRIAAACRPRARSAPWPKRTASVLRPTTRRVR